jgi:serine/threonine protein kinase
MRKQADEQMHQPGDKVWQYEIEKYLGRGTFGYVYRAKSLSFSKRKVAIKQLRMKDATPAIVERFIHEAKAMAELQHPNIVLIFELIEPERYPNVESYYIVMDFLEGGTLADWLEREDCPLDNLPEIFRVTREILRGLEAAHQANIIHRDIKPANILLDSKGERIVVCDWGLAHLDEFKMTSFGDIMGTLDYMSPEQAAGRADSADGRADLYSVGVMLYEMVTGHLPLNLDEIHHAALIDFRSRDPFQALDNAMARQFAYNMCLKAIQHNPRIDPRTFVPEISPGLRALLLKAIAADPESRYQSAREFIQALDELARRDNIASTSQREDPRKTKVAALLTQARQQREEHSFSQAINLLQEARQILRGEPGVCLEMAKIYNMLGQHLEAAQVLEEANQQNPLNYVILRDLGITYLSLKDSSKALQALNQSLELNPNQSHVIPLVKRLGTSKKTG